MASFYSAVLEQATVLAGKGWSQPDIRQALMREHQLSWLRADYIATDAVARDNEARGPNAKGHAA